MKLNFSNFLIVSISLANLHSIYNKKIKGTWRFEPWTKRSFIRL